MADLSPPARNEIYLFPWIGVFAIDLLYTRERELLLFFIPFLIVIFRVFVTARRAHAYSKVITDPHCSAALSRAAAVDQGAAFVLLFFESGSVMANNNSVPESIWLFIGGIYILYVVLRELARSQWRLASAVACE